MEIALRLDPSSKITLQTQIFDQTVSLIKGGKLVAGAALPSSRELSRQLGVSRNTVSEAYDKLAAEGYIVTARAKGTFVSVSLPDQNPAYATGGALDERRLRFFANLPLPYGGRGLPGLYEAHDPGIRTDFRFGRSDPRSFPEKVWRRLLLEILGGAAERLSQYNDPAGLPELRSLIATSLGPARGMAVTQRQTIIVAGFQQGIALAGHLLVGVNTPVVMEAPCYRGAAYLFESYGGRIVPVGVDEDGILVDRLPNQRVKLVYVTPSHQFPTGVTMSLERRMALLDWAATNGTYILEVDYDADFRYDGAILPSLQSLDQHGCVIYLNSFSRSIGPGLRLGYMVVPQGLVTTAVTLKSLVDNGSPWLEQATLAEFMRNGSLASHLKRLRQTYKSRRDALVHAIGDRFPGSVITGADGGTHMMWRLAPGGPTAVELHASARAVGVGLHPLATSVLHEDVLSDWDRRILLGYTHLTEEQIVEAFSKIAKCSSGLKEIASFKR
jgi:GntR family transcriptional regulator/MocR family aminotransferase